MVDYTYVSPAEGGTLDRDVGQNLTETAWDGILSDILRLGSTDGGIARATAQFDRTDATVSSVPGLSLNIAAGQSYSFRAVLWVNYPDGNGIKVGLSGSATATSIIAEVMFGFGTQAYRRLTRITGLGGTSGDNGVNGTAGIVLIDGLITVNAAGTFTVEFAQNTAGGTSSVLVGSYFELRSA